MKTRLFLISLALSLAFLTDAVAQAPAAKAGDKKGPPPKGPADIAYEEFVKIGAQRPGKIDQTWFKKIISAGIDYLNKYPTSGRSAELIRLLADFPTTSLRDKALAPQRAVYISSLKYDVLDARIKAESDEAKTAVAALDAAAADAEMRESSTPANQETLREKIDALAALPGSERFLVDRERSYFQIVLATKGPAKAADHLKPMLTHKDKRVADMARLELNLLEIKSAPYELKFTGLDGKEVDFAQLRGKVVALYFWSSTNGNSTRNFDALKLVHSDYRKKGFEVVTVSFDKAEDREKLEAYVKQNGIKWPVYFDGKGAKNEFASKLAATSVPRLVIFDQKGIMQSNNLQIGMLEPAVRQLLGIK